MDARLEPIEKPSSLLMQVVYAITKRRFGKVISPLKVIYSRLPFGFSLFSNKIQELDQKLVLDPSIALMVRIYVAQINVCHFCIDIAKAKAMSQYKDTDKFYRLQEYKESSIYSDREKAALAMAEELTLTRKIEDGTYQRAEKYFSERELIEISWLVATEHYYNFMNISFNLHSDNLCDMRFKK